MIRILLFLLFSCDSILLLCQNVFAYDTLVVSSTDQRFLLSFSENEKGIMIDGLEPGSVYHIGLAAEVNASSCAIYLDNGVSQADLMDENYTFLADAGENAFILKKETNCSVMSSVWLCINAENKQAPLMLANTNALINFEQIDNSTGEQFLGCYQTSHFQINGASEGIAGFANMNVTGVGLESGLFLCTGSFANVNFGSTFLATTNQSRTGDSDLTALASCPTEDANLIEFDIIPEENYLDIEYVFCSEEYCNFSGTPFKDIFGIFLSGPGINGPFSKNSVNIATVPDTNLFVNVNTINELNNADYFIANSKGTCGLDNNVNIVYNGLTKVLNTHYPVIAGEQYHVKIAIGDTGDGNFDSGAFVRLRRTCAPDMGVRAMLVSEHTKENYTFENCTNDAVLRIVRSAGIGDSLMVYLDILSSSSAQPGQDFSMIPESIVMLPFQIYYEIPFQILSDQITEGEEKIILKYSPACAGFGITEFSIFDAQPLEVTLNDVCSYGNSIFTIKADVSGGLPFQGAYYVYSWNGFPGISTTSQIFDFEAGEYTVIVQDYCGNTAMDTSTAYVFPSKPTAVLHQMTPCNSVGSICVDILIHGSETVELLYSIDGVIQPPIVTSDTLYTIKVSNANVVKLEEIKYLNVPCSVVLHDSIFLEPDSLQLNYSVSVALTAVDNGKILLSVLGGNPDYSNVWSTGDVNVWKMEGLSPGPYSVTVTDRFGDSISQDFYVESVTGIPTMSQWGLFIFGLVFFTFGVVAVYNFYINENREKSKNI